MGLLLPCALINAVMYPAAADVDDQLPKTT